MRFRWRGWVRYTRLVIGAVLASVLLGACTAPDSFRVVTEQGRSIQTLFVAVLFVSLFVFLLVTGVVTWELTHFRSREGEQGMPRQTQGNVPLEIAWTVTPVIVLAVLFTFAVRTILFVNAAPPDPVHVTIVGHQWWWAFQYPDHNIVTANELHVPVGETVAFDLRSVDVIHSFWVPRFGWKKDAVPGKTNTMTVRTLEPGIFDGGCTQYCGAEHAWMRIRVVAESPAEFAAWVAQQQQPAAAPQSEAAKRGERLFMSHPCVVCHLIGGTDAEGTVGPSLTHLASRATIGAGIEPNTPEVLARWVRDAHSIKPDVLMPAFTSLSDADIDAIVQYLEGLK